MKTVDISETIAASDLKFGRIYEKVKTVDFSETIAASDLKIGRSRHLNECMKVCEY